MNTRLIALALAGVSLAGCGGGKQLQYDWGRSYMTAVEAEADLQRTSAQGYVYELSGVEGVKLRQLVEDTSTDEESGAAKMIE